MSKKTGIGFPGQFIFVGQINIRLTAEYDTDRRNPKIVKIRNEKKIGLGSFLKLNICFVR
ncbi:MAG: hypothetical protein CL893_00210 [Dehalococcoidia bacterium]|nr:hypothetical protein [Dehalococcoidia bacterium]|tara:strand:- start:3382 stop:3561 length:180 start_codon:yes stop_codon:yes gene_type:complete